jgi:hypothetical protein
LPSSPAWPPATGGIARRRRVLLLAVVVGALAAVTVLITISASILARPSSAVALQTESA